MATQLLFGIASGGWHTAQGKKLSLHRQAGRLHVGTQTGAKFKHEEPSQVEGVQKVSHHGDLMQVEDEGMAHGHI